MFKKKKVEWFDNYKKNLNEWFVFKKEHIFNLETGEKECFLEIVPMEIENKFFYKEVIVVYKVPDAIYNKIQANDIIKLIVEKKEEN